MVTRFRPLEAGEPVGVVALSGPVDPEALAGGLAALWETGHPVVVAPNVQDRWGYLAGEDGRRLEGLLHVLDAGARVVVAARGGYGVSRVLDRMPWERLVRDGVVFVGFSDLSSLLNHLAGRGGAVQVHGPMAAVGLARPANRDRLLAVLEGRLAGRVLFGFGPGRVVRPGRARGRAVGGNLTVLCSTLGTPWEPDFEGSVLFMEEVGEPLYRLDRLLTQLRASGKLDRVKALIGGSLRGCKPASQREETWNRLLREAAPPGVPVVSGLPFGHGARNQAIPVGATVEVDTGTGRITWGD
ncbi:MAG: LD-carboxypeptidase [Acidobacteria bacterium]|nr:LD-carboxypeptidase [Acidobacteriota bacterium]